MLMQRRKPYTEPVYIVDANNCKLAFSAAEIQQQII